MRKLFMSFVMSAVLLLKGNDLMYNVNFDIDGDFSYSNNNGITKSIRVTSTSYFLYKGKLSFTISDPENNRVIYQKTNDIDFSADKPFIYTFNVTGLAKKSLQLNYTFTEEESGKSKSKTELTPYILTPEAGDKPRINGADVFGARPGNPFLYHVPATGKKPLTYKVTDLPDGLRLDSNTGIITGTVYQKGDYPVVFTVQNHLGRETKKFIIKIGDQI
ncbi:MAG TPA: Ig domain-containing protein, partial [Mucilaginibacter sp.]